MSGEAVQQVSVVWLYSGCIGNAAEQRSCAGDVAALRVFVCRWPGCTVSVCVQVARLYSEWALTGNYEEELSPERYLGPRYASDELAGLLKDRIDARIIDVAAGSRKGGRDGSYASTAFRVTLVCTNSEQIV